MLRIGMTLALLVACSQLDLRAQDTQAKKALASLSMRDIEGKSHSPFADDKTKAVALLFVSKDCPIANSFQPALRKFADEYSDKGVRSYMVYCSPRTTDDQIRTHVRDFDIRMPAILDSEQSLGRLTGAKVTPEAIIIGRDGTILYRGLINNLYAGYGKKRVAPTEHFLRDAADAVVAGKRVAVAQTKPVGCIIYYPKAKTP